MTLYGLANRSSSNRAMIISAGAIPLLKELCDSDKFFVQMAAATALLRLATDHSQSGTLSGTLALPTLVRMLTPGNSSSRARGSKAKGDVTQAADSNSYSQVMLDKYGNITCGKEGQMDPDALNLQRAAQVSVLVTLKDNLRDSSYRKGSMLELQLAAGVPEAVVTVLKATSTAVPVQVYATELLCEMMATDSDTAINIAAAGAVQALLSILQHGKAGTYAPTATALYYLTAKNSDNKAAFVTDSGLPVVTALLGHPDKRMHAAQLLDALVSGGQASSSILSAAVTAGHSALGAAADTQ